MSLQWWKSSRSGSDGGQCVEIAVSGWRKSSRSGSSGGACVEVADGGERWHVRDSKDPDGGMLCVAAPSWHAFVAAVKTDTV